MYGRLGVYVSWYDTTQTSNRPYNNLRTDYQVMAHVLRGGHPSRPRENECHGLPMPDKIWNIAELCWKQDPSTRPAMSEVYEYLINSDSSKLSHTNKPLAPRSQSGNSKPHNEAVPYYQGAHIGPPKRPNQDRPPVNPENERQALYKSDRDQERLEKAVVRYREALALRPPGHNDRDLALRNLGGGLMSTLSTWPQQPQLGTG